MVRNTWALGLHVSPEETRRWTERASQEVGVMACSFLTTDDPLFLLQLEQASPSRYQVLRLGRFYAFFFSFSFAVVGDDGVNWGRSTACGHHWDLAVV